jgi:hypothetical protein
MLWQLPQKKGQDWENRNKSSIENIRKVYGIEIEIHQWNVYLEQDSYKAAYQFVEELNTNDSEFQKAVNSSVEHYLKRHLKENTTQLPKEILERHKFLSRQHELEQVAVLKLWIDRAQQSGKKWLLFYKNNLHPAMYQCLQKTTSSNNNLGCLEHVKYKYQPIKQAVIQSTTSSNLLFFPPAGGRLRSDSGASNGDEVLSTSPNSPTYSPTEASSANINRVAEAKLESSSIIQDYEQLGCMNKKIGVLPLLPQDKLKLLQANIKTMEALTELLEQDIKLSFTPATPRSQEGEKVKFHIK